MSKQLVLMDHDGGIDNFLATMLLITMTEVEAIGIVITPADCYPKAAVSVTRKILDFMAQSEIPVAESTVRGINPFPPLGYGDSYYFMSFRSDKYRSRNSRVYEKINQTTSLYFI